jgi:hypothetical protein
MRHSVDLVALGNTASLFLAFTYTFCVAFDLAFPQFAMFEAWRKLLPGFEWISWKSFFLGLVESYGFGWYFALVWAPLYNYFAGRSRA